MADYKMHTAGGVAVAGAAYAVSALMRPALGVSLFDDALGPLPPKVSLFAVAIFFALWPDIDTNSIFHELFYGCLVIVDCILIAAKLYFPAALLGLFAMIPMLGKHRGWTHSRAACMLVPLPLLVVPMVTHQSIVFAGLPWYSLAAAAYCSHLVIDRKFFQ